MIIDQVVRGCVREDDRLSDQRLVEGGEIVKDGSDDVMENEGED
jgi:hypothetical protein